MNTDDLQLIFCLLYLVKLMLTYTLLYVKCIRMNVIWMGEKHLTFFVDKFKDSNVAEEIETYYFVLRNNQDYSRITKKM